MYRLFFISMFFWEISWNCKVLRYHSLDNKIIKFTFVIKFWEKIYSQKYIEMTRTLSDISYWEKYTLAITNSKLHSCFGGPRSFCKLPQSTPNICLTYFHKLLSLGMAKYRHLGQVLAKWIFRFLWQKHIILNHY